MTQPVNSSPLSQDLFAPVIDLTVDSEPSSKRRKIDATISTSISPSISDVKKQATEILQKIVRLANKKSEDEKSLWQNDRIIALAKEGLALQFNDLELRAQLLNHFGSVLVERGELDLAIDQYQEALELELVNEKLKARILNNKGRAHFKRNYPAQEGTLNDRDFALVLAFNALQCQFDEQSTKDRVILNLSIALKQLLEEDQPSHFDLIQTCADLLTLDCKMKEAWGKMLVDLASVLYQKKQQKLAVQFLEKARSFPLKDPDLKAQIVRQLIHCMYSNPFIEQLPPANKKSIW